MKKTTIVRTVFSLIFMLVTACLYSQVTIGSGTAPAKAAILDLKTKEGALGAATTDENGGGLLLSRVNLVSITSLKPFAIGDSDNAGKLEHRGLVVYNLTNDTNFAPGAYIWNGSQWEAVKDINSTVYTGIAPIDITNEAVSLVNGGVSTIKLADGAVTNTKLATNSVTTAKITDANVTESKLATNSVSTNKIVDSNVTTVKIADSNITNAKLAINSVTTAKINNQAVTSEKIMGGTTKGYVLTTTDPVTKTAAWASVVSGSNGVEMPNNGGAAGSAILKAGGTYKLFARAESYSRISFTGKAILRTEPFTEYRHLLASGNPAYIESGQTFNSDPTGGSSVYYVWTIWIIACEDLKVSWPQAVSYITITYY